MASSRGEAPYLVTRKCIASLLRRSAENRTLSARVLEALRLPQPHSTGLLRPVPTCGFEGLPGNDRVAFTGFLIDPEGGYIGMLALPEHGRDDILDEVNPRSCLSFSRRAIKHSVRPNPDPCKDFFAPP